MDTIAIPTISTPDGYNGDVAICDIEPLFDDGNMAKLQIHNSYMILWRTKKYYNKAICIACKRAIVKHIKEQI